MEVGVHLIFALTMRDNLEQAAQEVLLQVIREVRGSKVVGAICTIAAHPLIDAVGGGRPTLGPTPGSSQRLTTASG